MITIVAKNESTVVTDQQVKDVLAALQVQIDRDFCPSWGLGQFHLEFRAKDAPVAPGEWQFVFLDNTTDASALGYHDITANGDPIGYVGVQETINDGGIWSVTASHELCEMALNPRLDDSENDSSSGRFYIKEACDAVEADELGYEIAGQRVSDFVLPGWFQPEVAHTKPLSFVGHVTKPFELAPGGYISFIDPTSGSGWQQIFAKSENHADRKRPGTSRGAMRERVRANGGEKRPSAPVSMAKSSAAPPAKPSAPPAPSDPAPTS